MGWLSGWDKRIKLTVQHADIDADVSHFPVTVFLSSTHGDCVFDELTSDANRTKIAFTKSDGTTQMYGEIEKWDDANEVAIIHVSLSGWSISSSADTDFYMYYDSGHAANTTYIGDIDSTPGHSVWDSSYKFVCHMVDATTSSVKDSTSNGNDGTKTSASNPCEVNGKVGKGQDFSSDAIRLIGATPTLSNLTLEAVCKADVVSSERFLITRDDTGTMALDWWFGNDRGYSKVLGCPNGIFSLVAKSTSTVFSVSTWYHAVFTWDSTTAVLFMNGSSVPGSSGGSGAMISSDELNIGARKSGGEVNWDGIIDEVRISNSARTAAWIKATYNTLWDTLLTYGSEETSGWTGKVMGVTNPAKIMGVAVADIKSVMGVE